MFPAVRELLNDLVVTVAGILNGSWFKKANKTPNTVKK